MPPTKDDGPWRTRGAPHYLDAQATRLDVPRPHVEHPRVKDNRQLAKIAGLLGQLQREYYQAPRYGDDRSFSKLQMDAIVGILGQCEGEVGKVHAIAAAGAEMTDEAYDAFGLARPARGFSIVAASESTAESIEVVRPPSITDEEVASLRSEIERLRAENESLAERLTEPTDVTRVDPPKSHPHHRRSPAQG
jgi:hypothetical protein